VSSGERFARAGDIELCYETFGDESHPPLLLIMGLNAQMVLWDDEFCATLAGRGFQVIRFDNRDIGRSTILRQAPVPTRWQLLRRDPRGASYTLEDMAGDTAGLLGELGLGAAHVVGVSMGGMIAQALAIEHPTQVRSLVSIMSTTGNRRVGGAHPQLYPHLLRRARTDREGYIEGFLDTYRKIGSRRYPPDEVRKRAMAVRSFERGVHPAGAARQLAAIVAAADRTPLLRHLDVPTTVIHGDSDRLVSPSGGKATAAAVPDARLVVIPGMAHDMPPVLWPQLIDEIVRNAGRVSMSAAWHQTAARNDAAGWNEAAAWNDAGG
jgi:pimeloyl-ACP methyl ester carboxylesterase